MRPFCVFIISIVWLFKKLVKPEIALLGSILFLFNSSMVFHSRFIWIIHPFPLFGLITSYFFLKNLKKPSLLLAGVLGLVTGLGIGMDYTFLFWGIPLFFGLLFYSSHRFQTALLFVAGGLIGDLPHVLFDLRHQFYNISTLWQYSLETLSNPSQSKILYYHFFPFWPKTDYDLTSPSNYELSSFYPYKIQVLTVLDENYRVYKLYK
ncbi:glycosyltransferase family 39 protein [Patescibacteria group bacterium]|nr:glycosyltransferase family 39 protein [Patescibacteria group bacterium]